MLLLMHNLYNDDDDDDEDTDLGQEAFDSWVGGDQIQEGRHQLGEAGGRYANQEGPAGAPADVVGVTNHVVHEDLLGASAGALQPVPEGTDTTHQLLTSLWDPLLAWEFTLFIQHTSCQQGAI